LDWILGGSFKIIRKVIQKFSNEKSPPIYLFGAAVQNNTAIQHGRLQSNIQRQNDPHVSVLSLIQLIVMTCIHHATLNINIIILTSKNLFSFYQHN